MGDKKEGKAVLRLQVLEQIDNLGLDGYVQGRYRLPPRPQGPPPQDSTSSLNPRMTVADIISEPMAIHRIRPPRGTRRDEAAFQLRCVGMDAAYLDKHPGELSGGQRQRVAIARALCMGSGMGIADSNAFV